MEDENWELLGESVGMAWKIELGIGLVIVLERNGRWELVR